MYNWQFLILNGSTSSVDDEVEAIEADLTSSNQCQVHEVKIDPHVFKREHLEKLITRFKFKPDNNSTAILLVLKGFENLSEIYQNALLKFFEEPSAHVKVIITTTNIRAILPTILSRGEIRNVYDLKKRPDIIIDSNERISPEILKKIFTNQKDYQEFRKCDFYEYIQQAADDFLEGKKVAINTFSKILLNAERSHIDLIIYLLSEIGIYSYKSAVELIASNHANISISLLVHKVHVLYTNSNSI